MTRMIRRVDTRYVALLLFFTFCQVIGSMCALPGLSVAEETASLVEARMACPMDGTIMCPPSITSSPERQLKHSIVLDVDHAPMLISLAEGLPVPAVLAQWSWSSVCYIVPLSIGASSVLRI